MALEWLKTGQFRVLVTDLMIPNGCGAELVNWCLKQDVGMRLVLVSGDEVEAMKLLGPESVGKVTVLKKPFHMAELLRCVQVP
jgi:DNA-binding response OmpR family regulator